jgi:putative protease
VSAKKPELLAPAGDRLCLQAAIENGADAVYFGLHAHNARARAANFDDDELPRVMAQLHQRGMRGYVTLNTLIFPGELQGVESLIKRIADAGVDAVIVQDLGVCRLIRALCPSLEIHASTQMSISSAAGVRMAEELGCSRVILARELSIDEIAKIRAEVFLPVEVFVHGALCVAYSGQCLTSEALGARSANRGECAQACRMPYQIVCDGEPVELDKVQYLLSPQDLAAFELVPKLVALGVASLKIEGRLKSPEYVASITRHYRHAIDAAFAGLDAGFTQTDIQEMALTFSRGFSRGFLEGNDHKRLVRGDYAKKRGLFVGEVRAVNSRRVLVEAQVPLKPGDGVVFEEMSLEGAPEQGGRVFDVRWVGAALELGFDARAIDLKQLAAGQRLWKTDDPALTKRLRASFEGPPKRLVDLNVYLEARCGHPLKIEAVTADGRRATVVGDFNLAAARSRPANVETLREQFDRLGGTVYRLAGFDCEVAEAPLVPASALNALRRTLVIELDRRAESPADRPFAGASVLAELRSAHKEACTQPETSPTLVALCRNGEQAIAAIESHVHELHLDFQHIKDYSAAIRAIRAANPEARVFLAPPRIEKPGESPIFSYLAKQGADGFLVRNAGSLEFCGAHDVPFVADYSMNAANELTVGWLHQKGAERVTASYDLSLDQLLDLARATNASWLEVVIHQHMPMFHMEHCVFCAFLSPGHDKTDCGRPCDDHTVELRDRVGMEHPLVADVGCRNTLFNAVPQTAAEYLTTLVELGIRRFRVEFLRDSPALVSRILSLYQEALAGRTDPRALWKHLKATNRYGVTRGQLAILD